MQEFEEPTKSRRVRPWLAGLLTVFGWGLGLYYAGHKKAAIRMAGASVILAVITGLTLVFFLAAFGPIENVFVDPNSFNVTDAASLLISILLALGVTTFVSRKPAELSNDNRPKAVGYALLYLTLIIIAVVFALIIRWGAYQPFSITSGSMAPTLKSGSVLVASKWTYGYSRYSLSPLNQFFPEGRTKGAAPSRGDVVVFRSTRDNYDYVKRLIGLPGDTIEMVGGALHINGAPILKEAVTEIDASCDGRSAKVDAFRETLPNGANYVVAECHGDRGRLDNVGPFTVPDGHYFVMGDNRDQSLDSRVISQVGFIPHENLIGKIILASE